MPSLQYMYMPTFRPFFSFFLFFISRLFPLSTLVSYTLIIDSIVVADPAGQQQHQQPEHGRPQPTESQQHCR